MERIPGVGVDANGGGAPVDRRLAVSFAEASFVLQLERHDVERLVMEGGLAHSVLHGAGRITVASLEALVESRIGAGTQSLLARWVLEQLVRRRLQAPSRSTTANPPPPLLDAVAPMAIREPTGAVS